LTYQHTGQQLSYISNLIRGLICNYAYDSSYLRETTSKYVCKFCDGIKLCTSVCNFA